MRRPFIMSAVATAAALIFSAHLIMMDCGERAGGEGAAATLSLASRACTVYARDRSASS